MSPGRWDWRGGRWLAAGALLWLMALVSKWPVSVTFEDEVGYLGETRLLLEGHLRPAPESPGIWIVTDNGRVAKFPLLVSLMVAPLFALSPRLVFASGVAAALGLAFVASRVLKAWGRSPAWGLVILAHPTIVIMARTVMADLLLATFSLAGWWALRRGRLAGTVFFLTLVVATKATGFAIASALVVGEVVRDRQNVRQRDHATITRLAWGLFGIVGGVVLTAVFNLLTVGKPWFVYGEAHSYLGTPSFWPRYFVTSAPVYLSSLLLLPPALVVGAWPFWRRREIGPLLVVLGIASLMCFYFFVDRGRTRVETLVLSQRLVLSAVVFLLVGYAEVAACLASRVPRATRILAPIGVMLLVTTSFEVSRRHRGWQDQNATALSAASRVLAETGAPELGLTVTSVKAGIMASVPVEMAGLGERKQGVVLCNTQSSSYRAPRAGFSCLLEGYRERDTSGTFHVLVRQPR